MYELDDYVRMMAHLTLSAFVGHQKRKTHRIYVKLNSFKPWSLNPLVKGVLEPDLVKETSAQPGRQSQIFLKNVEILILKL